jgi:hypothetical protein
VADEVDPLGQGVKDAIATMGMLEALGLQKLNITIPRCIVLGTFVEARLFERH